MGNAINLNSITGKGDLLKRLETDGNWWSYDLDCDNYSLRDISYGDGRAVAIIDTLSWNKQSIFTFRHDDGLTRREIKLGWSSDLLKDTTRMFWANEAAWVNGMYYFACLDGGLVMWDYNNESTVLFMPDSNPVAVNRYSVKVDTSKKIDTTFRVTGVKRYNNSVLVTTPAKIWVFSTVNSTWDSSIASTFSDTMYTFKKFQNVFAALDNGTFYSSMQVRKKGATEDTQIFVKYNRVKKTWSCMFDKAPVAVSFAANGYFYSVTDSNTVRLYRDTLGDSTVVRNPAPIVDRNSFELRMTPADYGISFPQQINDLLYISKNDSSGYLWIATSEGVFLSENEKPGISKGPFHLYKRAPKIKDGLKQSYAVPGILTGVGSSCFIAYNLSKDASVTIRIYDYNMDLVKTVIKGKLRKAGDNGGPAGRSTVNKEDMWDGRTDSGRMAAPGVYYYKITTDIGERAFGKIVLAK
jgi:hypothetical protein